MAMDQSALLELLDALKGAGVDDRVRIEAAAAFHDRRGSGVAYSEAADRVVLPVAAGAPPAHRPGAVRGRYGGLPARGEHP